MTSRLEGTGTQGIVLDRRWEVPDLVRLASPSLFGSLFLVHHNRREDPTSWRRKKGGSTGWSSFPLNESIYYFRVRSSPVPCVFSSFFCVFFLLLLFRCSEALRTIRTGTASSVLYLGVLFFYGRHSPGFAFLCAVFGLLWCNGTTLRSCTCPPTCWQARRSSIFSGGPTSGESS